MKTIPAMAQWLLERFGITRGNPALMGDLVEEYSSGRSTWWVWRQTLLAIAAVVIHEPRARKPAILRAVVLVVALNFVAIIAAQQVVRNFAGLSHDGAFWMVFGVFNGFVWPAIVGWVVASAHRAHRAGAVVAYLTLLTIWAGFRLCMVYQMLSRLHQVDLFIGFIGSNCLTLGCALVGGLLPNLWRMCESADSERHRV